MTLLGIIGIYVVLGLVWDLALFVLYMLRDADDDSSGDIGLAYGAGMVVWWMPWIWPGLIKDTITYLRSKMK